MWLARGRNLQKDLRKPHRSPLVVALNVPLCSLHANISVVRTIASDKGQEQRMDVGMLQSHVHLLVTPIPTQRTPTNYVQKIRCVLFMYKLGPTLSVMHY